MALYAIGDLHLAYQAPCRAPMQLTDPVWVGHEQRLLTNCRKMIRPADTLVLVGDHGWGHKLSDCEEDLAFIESLPGRKILLRGNHDMFWDVKKTAALNERYAGRLFFLQNNYAVYENYAIVGTKGYCWEGRDTHEHAAKLVEREAERLRSSFEAALHDGFREFIMFLHYPPTSILERESLFTKMAREYGAEQVIYAHCHGRARFHDSIRGTFQGRRYTLVSGDCLNWVPKRIS